MAKRLRMIYDQMAIPRYVIAMGDCAISGGLFHDSYSIVNGAHEFLPVDVFVPGCPPRPEALEHGIIMLQEKIRYSKMYPQLLALPTGEKTMSYTPCGRTLQP